MLDFEIKKIRAISNSLNKKETSKEKLTHSLAHLNLQASLFTSRIASDRIAILGQQSERAENSLEEGRQQSTGFSNSNPKTERQSNEKGTQMQY